MNRAFALAVLLVCIAALAGCASESFREGRAMVEAGNEDEGLARIEEALRADPEDREMRNYYLRYRTVAVQRHLALGDNARSVGALEQAQAAYQRALRLEPDNARRRVSRCSSASALRPRTRPRRPSS